MLHMQGNMEHHEDGYVHGNLSACSCNDDQWSDIHCIAYSSSDRDYWPTQTYIKNKKIMTNKKRASEL